MMPKHFRTIENKNPPNAPNDDGKTATLGGVSNSATQQFVFAGRNLCAELFRPSVAVSLESPPRNNGPIVDGDFFSKATINTCANDTTNWSLGRLTGSTVTSVAP